jgi:hypothetical protein
MPSVNVLRNINLAIDRRGAGGCAPASIGPDTTCGENNLGYIPTSFDDNVGQWLPANLYGVPAETSSYGYVTGSSELIKVIGDNGCPYDALYLDGELTLPLNGADGLNIGIVTGSFTISGNASNETPGEGGTGWYITVETFGTSSVSLEIGTDGGGPEVFTYEDWTVKNALVGFELGTYTSPFERREVTLYTSGSAIATNPPYTNIGFPNTLGDTYKVSGTGIIRSLTLGGGTLAQQAFYNCIFGSHPQKTII